MSTVRNGNVLTVGQSSRRIFQSGIPIDPRWASQYLILEDTAHPPGCERTLVTISKQVLAKGAGPNHDRILTADFSIDERNRMTLTQRFRFKGVMLYIDAARMMVPFGTHYQKDIIPGAISFCADTTKRYGHACGGEVFSSTKQQLCVLLPGEHCMVAQRIVGPFGRVRSTVLTLRLTNETLVARLPHTNELEDFFRAQKELGVLLKKHPKKNKKA